MSRPLSAPSSPSGAASPWTLPTLRERLERARQPGASVSDVDLLVAGLMPDAVTEAMTPRERADLLLDILDDASLSRRKDHGGRRVSHVAARALLALGYPYALELPVGAMPPTEYEPPPATPPEDAPPMEERVPLTRWNLLGLLLVLGASVGEWQLLRRRSAVPPQPRNCGMCDVWLMPTKSVLLHSLLSFSLLLLTLAALLQGMAVLAALARRESSMLRLCAQAQWAGGVVRGGQFAILWCLSVGLFRREDPVGYATSIVLLVTGAVMGLAGFCFQPRPSESEDA